MRWTRWMGWAEMGERGGKGCYRMRCRYVTDRT